MKLFFYIANVSVVLGALLVWQSASHPSSSEETELLVLPFGTTTLVPVGLLTPNNSYDISSLARRKYRDLEQRLVATGESCKFKQGFMRLTYTKGSSKMSVDSDGCLAATASSGRKMSPAEFRSLKEFLFAIVPRMTL
jgi:hypothetical protein